MEKIFKMTLEDFMLPCFFKKFLGVECFGCGTQRSFLLVMKGEFEKAFVLYPAIFPLLILFLGLGIHFIDKKRDYTKVISTIAVIYATTMVVSYFHKHHL